MRIVVHQVNGRRIAKLKEELGYLDTPDFIRTIPLAEEKDTIEDLLYRYSPKGGHVSQTQQWLFDNGLATPLPSFSKGWRVSRHTEANRLSWNISHILETSRQAGSMVKFKSIEFGSQESTWTAKRDFSFKDYGFWSNIQEGQEVRHAGNEPANVLGQVSEYVKNVMLPQVRTKVTRIVRQRLSRA